MGRTPRVYQESGGGAGEIAPLCRDPDTGAIGKQPEAFLKKRNGQPPQPDTSSGIDSREGWPLNVREIIRYVQLRRATFTPKHDSAQPLLPAIFLSRADFREATFAEVYFNVVSFEEVDLTGARFTDSPDAGVRFTGKLSLANATYRRLILDDLDFTILGSPHPNTLKRLEENFRALGHVELANEAFYRRKVVERGEKPAFKRMGELMILDWPAGYGVRPLNTLGVSAGFIMLFAIVYYAADVVRYRILPEDANFRFRLTDIPIVSMESEGERHAQRGPIRSRMQRVWDAINFSFSVYTKLGTGRRVARKWQGVVIAEWLLGLLMFAVFFYTLSNSVPVLQRLLSAVV